MEVKLVVIGGKHAGTAIPIPGPKFLIGRGEGCHFRPQSHLVSRKHCAIVVQEGSVTIEDAGSTNGTFVNDERVQQQRELKSGDRIKVGGFELEVELSATLEGKKKPKVNNVQEAAARTVAASVSPEGELDVSGWLADEEAEQKPASPSPKAAAAQDTFVGKVTDDTTTMQASQGAAEKEKDKQKPRPKPGSTSLRAAKPMADSSRTAAEDVLRHLFPRRKA
jgi:pSer/pThr/pTyr-binding forkhead associated (FHA) protein